MALVNLINIEKDPNFKPLNQIVVYNPIKGIIRESKKIKWEIEK